MVVTFTTAGFPCTDCHKVFVSPEFLQAHEIRRHALHRDNAVVAKGVQRRAPRKGISGGLVSALRKLRLGSRPQVVSIDLGALETFSSPVGTAAAVHGFHNRQGINQVRTAAPKPHREGKPRAPCPVSLDYQIPPRLCGSRH